MKSIRLPGDSYPTSVNLIIWLEGEANYTRVHYENETNSIVTKSLNHFEQYAHLVRVHRSVMINSMYVHEFINNKGRSGLLRMANGKTVPVSRVYIQLVNSLFGVSK